MRADDTEHPEQRARLASNAAASWHIRQLRLAWALWMVACSGSALAAEVLTIPRPYNAEEIPLPLPTGNEGNDSGLAAVTPRLSQDPTAGWKPSILAMLELTTWSVDDAMSLLDQYPGVVWQAVRPDIRPWLLLVGSLPADQLQALLEGVGQTVALEDAPAEFAAFLRSEAGVRDDASIVVQLDVLWQFNPLPGRFIRGRIIQDGAYVDDGYFGVAERRARKVADAPAFRAWGQAWTLYVEWSSGDAGLVRFHRPPDLPGGEASAIAAKVDEACRVAAEWHHADPSEVCAIDLFLYPAEGMPRYGLPRHYDYALPSVMQVHQRATATRGHEVTHIVSDRAWGAYGNAFASEGIAMYLNQDFDPLERARSQGACRKQWSSLDDGMFDGSSAAYLQSAVAVAYVDATFGTDAVKALYLASDPAVVLSSRTGVAVSELEGLLCRWLESAAMPPPLCAGQPDDPG